MSSNSKECGFSDGIGPKIKEPAGPGGPSAPWAPGLDLDLDPVGRGEGQSQDQDQDQGADGGECRPSSPQALTWPLELDSGPETDVEMTQAETRVLWGCQAWRGTPALDGKRTASSEPQFAEVCAAFGQPLRGPGEGAVPQLPSIESGSAQAAGIWACRQADCTCSGALCSHSVESLQAYAVPPHVSARKEGWVWGPSKTRGTTQGLSIRTDIQRSCGEGFLLLPSDTEFSDELRDMHPMSVSFHQEGGGQAKGSSSEEAAESFGHSTYHDRADFPHISDPLLTSILQGLSWTMEGQPVGEMGPSSSKTLQSVIPCTGWDRSNLSGVAAAAAPASAWCLPQANPGRNPGEKKKSLGVDPEVLLRTAFAPWGHRESAALMEPDSFPPLSVSLLEKPSTSSPLPWGAKQSRQGGTVKKSGARRKREAQPMARGGGGPNRDPVPRTQFPAYRPRMPSQYSHHKEFISGDPNMREHQVGANWLSLSPSQRDIIPRDPAHSQRNRRSTRATSGDAVLY
ncbi:uncharacterized protein CXorf49 homolog isoform X1 [Oryctolagus cuniculus]|uniref:Uncharacterized protein n=1 Tax=Oryctolagus cuniculus TaxID=9986 RepID=U3KNL8_RABIT|nr:uncharacterized protein CXorf49 homolog isoform X2 [Oryctolagus cuniculus]